MATIGLDALQSLVGHIFERAGCPKDEAARIALYLSRANLTGHDSHGVIRVPRYVEWLERGWVVAGQHVETILDGGAILVLDAHHGFGQTVGPEAAALGIERAKTHGLALTALRNAGHLGRIGDFAEMGIEAGLVSVHLVNVNGSLLVAPFGASERRTSTNPIAIGVPCADDRPFVLDLATAFVAEGKVLVASQGGKPVPKGALVNERGELTDDPVALYGTTAGSYPDPKAGPGALRTFGEHKGSGLSLACDLLAGCLAGSGYSPTIEERIHNGMLSIWIDPQALGVGDRFAAEVTAYLDHIRRARPIDNDTGVLVPGDKERKTWAEREKNGVPIPDATWTAILGAARRTGMSDDEVRAITG